MASSAVLPILPTTHLTMTSSANTTNKNNILTPTVCNSDPTATTFGMYQQTSFGLNEISIHTLVSNAISVKPYLLS